MFAQQLARTSRKATSKAHEHSFLAPFSLVPIYDEPFIADAKRALSPPGFMHYVFFAGSYNMQTLGMAKARDGFAGVSVAPVVIRPVEGCEMVHDHVYIFQDIRQANREIQAKMRGVVAEIDKQ